MTDSALEHLRILREASACLRVEPDNPHALRRRDESLRRAAARHPLMAVADVAGLAPEVVLGVVGTQLAPEDRSRLGTAIEPGLADRARPVAE